jgi:hypothetical protein
MRPLLVALLLKADRREEISLPAVLAWPTFTTA